jgi:hypothetical protein
MKILKSLLRISLALAAAMALSSASTAWAQVDLTRIAWIGDSEGAGFSAGCLTKRVQVDSPSAVIARTENVADFQQPIVNDPGLGGCLVLTSLAPSFTQEPSTGTPANLALPRPYNNLSVPGCKVGDMLRATTASETSGGSCAAFIDLVLRNSALHLGSQVDQAIALNPTFVFHENVGNDYLGAVLSGTIIDGVTVTPVAPFTADYNTTLTKLAAKQPKGIVFGVADVTSIPFATTIPPFLTSGGKLVLNPATGQPIPLLGPKGCPPGYPACPIPATTLVTLYAAEYLPYGYGIPCAVAPKLPKCDNPLPAAGDPVTGNPGVLIYASDVAFLKQRGADYNTAIKAAAAASGYKYYDTNDFLLRLKAGFDFGGITINAAFLTGGAFSYDGFHLTPIGYAILADDVIQFMNANFNAGLSRVNLTTYLFNGGTNGGLSGSSSYAPLNGEDFERAVQAIFTPEFARQLASMFSVAVPEETSRHVPVAPGSGTILQGVERHGRVDQP